MNGTARFIVWALLLFWLLLAPGPRTIAAENHIVLLVMTGSGDRDWPTTDYDIASRTGDLKMLFPHSDVVLVNEVSNEAIRAKIRAGVSSTAVIDGIFVDSEGTGLYGKDGKFVARPENGDDRVRDAAAWIGNDRYRFHLYLTSPKEVADLFGPALDHLAPDAEIIFSACDLLSVGDGPREKLLIAKRIADSFRMKTGSLYLNEQAAFEGVRKLYGQPALQAPSPPSEIFMRSFFQTAKSETLPVIAAVQTFCANHGDRLEITEQDGRKTYRLYGDDFISALTDPQPSGALRYEWRDDSSVRHAQ